MNRFAIWRRLDMPGHDAALLSDTDDGHVLQGTAVFRSAEGAACLNYAVEVDHDWRARHGRVRGFLADRRIDHSISRETDGWYLDGKPVPGLGHLVDLDYGFTPATNILQLQRVRADSRETFDLPAAWFDIDARLLTELPQTYQHKGERTWRYAAPSVPYKADLEMSENGFVKRYPQLWIMES
jgi:hypothetical protein